MKLTTCPRCLGGLTSTDRDAGYCTQCKYPLVKIMTTVNALEASLKAQKESR